MLNEANTETTAASQVGKIAKQSETDLIMTRINQAMEMADTLATMTNTTSDRLLGIEPVNACDPKEDIEPNGTLGAINRELDNLQYVLSRAIYGAERLAGL